MNFRGKCILVTGGGRGIGRAIATGFADAGARVAFTYRSNEDAAGRTLESLAGRGHIMIESDVTDPESSRETVERTVGELGGLDVAVNNAGVAIPHAIDRVDYAEWQRCWNDTLSVNLVGAANLSYCAARHMMESGGGRIVMVSSRGAFRGEPEQPAYGASKAGLNALGQSLARSLAPFGIFVGIVAPGFVETELSAERLRGDAGAAIRAQSPLNRVAFPEEIAKVVLFLASEGSEFTTGTIIDVNGASYLRS
jgi:NAD(P)-dependent dehydrogenase (short-subunit alcohol dehydrogenase family)